MAVTINQFRRALILTTALSFGISLAHAQEVNVRSADHADFSRLVFDWPESIDYRISRDENEVGITFQSSGRPVFEDGDISRLSRVFDAEVIAGENETLVRLTVSPETEASSFRVGTKIAVDIKSVDIQVAPSNDAQRTADTLEVAVQAMNDADAAQAKAELEAREKQRQETLEAARKTLQDAMVADGQTTQAIEADVVEDSISFVFPVGVDVPAASFIRGNQLWVVFGEKFAFEYPGFEFEGIGAVSLTANEDVSIVKFAIVDDLHGKMSEQNGRWALQLSNQVQRLETPLMPVRHEGENGAQKAFIETTYKPLLRKIIDEDIGDELVLGLNVGIGEGVEELSRSSGYVMLPTIQGIAVERHSDDVQVRLLEKGITIETERAGQLAALLPAQPNHYLKLDDWRLLGGAGSFDDRRKVLLYTVSMARADDREAARLDLAKFFAAHGNHASAFGILKLMEEDNADLHSDPEYRALRGVVQFHLRRFDAAAADLSLKALETEADAALWRALISDAQGKFSETMQNYRLGLPALGHYSANDRARFGLSAARAAVALGEYGIAEREITKLKGVTLNPMRSSEASFIEAELARIYQDMPTALDIYDNLANAAPRPVAARARLASIKTRYDEGVLNTAQAIQDLEGLRYAWRGDVFEITLLRELGRLHVAQGDFRAGLEIMRQAISYFDKSEASKAVTRQMEALFQDLYLKGRADELEPLQAVALYYDFRELTPLGRDGDTMVRRLVDRMVSVDLLDRAAGLLEHQIKFRLEGVAQASVAARLAAILIKDQRPEKAVDIIRATRNVAEMPVDLRRERTQLEARAMIDLGHYGEAAAMLEDDDSMEAHLLRADLHWGAKDWPAIVENTETVLGNRWRDKAPLTIDEQRQILRTAVAYTMLEREEGLDVLRRRYDLAMTTGPFGNAFSVITGSGVASPSNLRAAVSNLADVDRLESFMDKYRVNEESAPQNL